MEELEDSKPRLVVICCSQERGVHYKETFSPGVKLMSTLQFYDKNSFQHEDLKEKIYKERLDPTCKVWLKRAYMV